MAEQAAHVSDAPCIRCDNHVLLAPLRIKFGRIRWCRLARGRESDSGLPDTAPFRWQDSGMETVTLWRPTGPEELALVESSGWREWPPRLPDQPIFYPVLNLEYATMIARDWNVKANGAGFVTRFQVRKDFLDRYEVQQAGGKSILEYWIPADDLPEFNANIVGTIQIVAEFR